MKTLDNTTYIAAKAKAVFGNEVEYGWYAATHTHNAARLRVFAKPNKWDTWAIDHPGIIPDFIPLDGQFRSSHSFSKLITQVLIYREMNYEIPWLIERGNAFIALNYYDQKGIPYETT